MRDTTRMALRSSLIYGVVAAAYILVSDRLVVSYPDQVQTWKGITFVAATSLLMFLLLRRLLRAQEDEATRRRRAVATSLSLDRRNEAFVRALGEIVYDHDVAADWIEWSGNTASVGWTKEELGTSVGAWMALVHPDDRVRVAAELERKAEVFVVEYRLRHRDGHHLWLFDRGVKVHAADGTLTHVTGVMWDVTERKVADEALRDSEVRFRQLADNINEVFWLVDVSTGTMLYVSPAYERIWGRSTTGLLVSPATWTEAIHPEDRERVRDDALALRDQEGYDVEYRIVRPDGEVRWVHDRAFPIRAAGGRVYRVAGVAEDITDRKFNEQTIQERLRLEQQLSRFAASAPGVLYTFRLAPDGTMSMPYCSPEMKRLTGLSPDELADSADPLLKLVHPADIERFAASIHESARTMAPWRAEFRVGIDDAMWLEGRSAPVLEPDGGILWHGFLSDITERKLLEDQLRQAQKMEALGQLAGGIAHDFNNLLTIIVGYSDLLLTSLPEGDRAREAIEEIRRAGERSAALTRQLLAFSRKQVLTPQVLDVNEVLRQTDRLLRRLIGEDVELSVRLAPAVDSVRADPGQLEQVILNLAVNARDAMPDGGTLLIETSNVQVHERDSRDQQQPAPGRYVRLTVADSGSGISPEVRPRLFEPFFTTKAPGHGTGLGLAVVHGFVKQTGGHIEVESQRGHGATFHIYLPRFESPRGLVTPHVVADTEMPVGDETILLVEDEDPVRLLAARVLEGCGYNVIAAASAQAALLACDAGQVRPMLLVTDVVMPEVGGPALARRVLALYPGVKVLYMSGYTNDAVVRSGIEEGAVEFLQKPFSPLDLGKKVRAVLDGPTPAAGQPEA